MFAVPPGLVAGCASDYSSFICVQPESVDRVRLKLGLMFFGDRWTQDDIDTAARLFQETNAEDRAVLEGITRGHASGRHAAGPLAPAAFEGTLHDFSRYLAQRLTSVLEQIDPHH
jgi:phenylpropionate dioxygenase-like ring-hydroxylating dioxygenase large terminal subunit